PSSPASFAVTRSRPACELMTPARTLTGDPSTAKVPGRPKRGIAQPGDTPAKTITTQARQRRNTRLTLCTPEQTRIHVRPRTTASYGWARNFCKTIWPRQAVEFPCCYKTQPLQRTLCVLALPQLILQSRSGRSDCCKRPFGGS